VIELVEYILLKKSMSIEPVTGLRPRPHGWPRFSFRREAARSTGEAGWRAPGARRPYKV